MNSSHLRYLLPIPQISLKNPPITFWLIQTQNVTLLWSSCNGSKKCCLLNLHTAKTDCWSWQSAKGKIYPHFNTSVQWHMDRHTVFILIQLWSRDTNIDRWLDQWRFSALGPVSTAMGDCHLGVYYQSPRPTQPPTLNGKGDEYQP